ncbi:MAG: M48 family metallopeptidase, partial [Methylococcaceae bacterium]|nr:M48 family metallopeptidase [Methylococcaceae bacterium]
MKLTVFALALTFSLYPGIPHAIEIEKIQLPDLGDSSGTLLSPAQEQEFGEEFFRQLHAQVEINQDPEIQYYIESIGKKLVAQSDNPSYPFHFFVVTDNNINAFAGPGGYIGVNSGLITLTEAESELASVMAHEIAHVTQRHLYRAVEEQGRLSIPMMAATLAGILIGMKSPELGQAAIMAAQAGSVQFQINFTRTNEQEADRVGMQTLSQSNFDPRSMPTFFERLQQSSRYYGKNVPEFLRTHPVTESRISDTRGRAENYPYRQYPSSQDFELARAKLQVANSVDDTLPRHFQQRSKQGTENQRAVARYGLALFALKSNDYAKAESLLNGLIQDHPQQEQYTSALARTAFEAKDYPKALNLFKATVQRFPDNEAIQIEYINTLLKVGQAETARKLLQPLLKAHPQPRFYALLAQAYGAL